MASGKLGLYEVSDLHSCDIRFIYHCALVCGFKISCRLIDKNNVQLFDFKVVDESVGEVIEFTM